MKSQSTYSITLYGKAIYKDIHSIQEAFIRAGSHDNYYCRFEPDSKGVKQLITRMSPSSYLINEQEQGILTIDEKDTKLNDQLKKDLTVGVFHSRYFAMSIEEDEEKETIETDAEKNITLNNELILAANENQTIREELTDAVQIIKELREEYAAATQRLDERQHELEQLKIELVEWKSKADDLASMKIAEAKSVKEEIKKK